MGRSWAGDGEEVLLREGACITTCGLQLRSFVSLERERRQPSN